MKTLELNNGYKIKVCETLEDINIRRFVAHKEWVIVKEQGLDFVKIPDIFRKFIKEVDEKSISGAVIVLYNYTRGLQYIQDREDADQLIFALISVVEGEDVSSTDTTTLKEKMNMLGEQGLTQGMVKTEVELFLEASRDN